MAVALGLLLAADAQLLLGLPALGCVAVAGDEHVPLLVQLVGPLLLEALQLPLDGDHPVAPVGVGVILTLLLSADQLVGGLLAVAVIGVGVARPALLHAAGQLLPPVLGVAGGGVGMAGVWHLGADQLPVLPVAVRTVGVGRPLLQGTDQRPLAVIA